MAPPPEPEPLTAAEEWQLQKEWWLRVPLAILAPRAVFTALRDESANAISARQEPVLLLVLLAGVAAILQTSAAGSLLDNPEIDGALIFVWAVIGGIMYGVVSYWIGGLAIYFGSRGASARGQAKPSYQRARHVVAFAAAPVVLSLILWPVQLAIYGSDTFKARGESQPASSCSRGSAQSSSSGQLSCCSTGSGRRTAGPGFARWARCFLEYWRCCA